ncbi:helix-turn-helix domain-containing protein [Vibrio sp. S9_S30]|uniref:AraC family transcriptional regulator n=1 Tax=Vibrio sp. S9_S30 TaxID=2720226 RepID=UPI001680B014|nr:AraC family transcriptional regulator [Vibrio sp. S9_S30]MBD1557273.1 helix-turn-helix domain-containing protein [Vibrio sp. S9_S30]
MNTTSNAINAESNVFEQGKALSKIIKKEPIIGCASSVLKIKQQMHFAIEVNMSVFITGESGTEKNELAEFIHQESRMPASRFIRISSSFSGVDVYQLHLEHALEEARNGTLYLEDIDVLSRDIQDFLIGQFTMGLYHKRLIKNNVRLMVSCRESLEELKKKNAFVDVLLDINLPHIEMNIPPLKKRSDDIPEYVAHILCEFGIGNDIHVSPSALFLLKQYDWPGNITQLRSFLILMASCCDGVICEDDVLSLGVISKKECTYDILETVLEQRYERLENLHPALRKALIFLGNNYTECIKLSDMASAAYTSPSHLSYLFREHLNLSFKAILVQIRIQKAKQLFDVSPMLKVTDVCLQSGFGDLSHFEKMFKRYADCTPRQYREQKRQRTQFTFAASPV